MKNLKAIILAAGRGKRLKPLTDEIPKGMVKLFGKSLLEWQINVFRSCKINQRSDRSTLNGDVSVSTIPRNAYSTILPFAI